MSEIKALNYKKGTLKSKLTLCNKYLDQVERQINSNSPIEKTTFYEIENRYLKLENLLSEFESVQMEIATLIFNQEEEIFDDLTEHETFEEFYYKVISRCRALMDSLSPQPEISANRVAKSASRSSRESYDSNSRMHIKLPTISLPKFDGSSENWLEFRDTFSSLIHENPDLPAVQKFHYLKASLTNLAEQIIKSITISDSNYEIAWNLICKRFNNRRSLIENHVRSLFNLENINKISAQSLRDLLDNTTKNIRALENLELTSEKWGEIFLTHFLSEKLDNETSKKWQEYKLKFEVPSFEDFKKFIENRAQLLENTEINSKMSSKQVLKYKQSTKSFAISYKKCSFCEESHNIYSCPKFLKLTPVARFQRVKELKLCVNCLRMNHSPKDCKAGSCKECQAKHNTLLHFRKQEATEKTTTTHGRTETSETLLSTAVIKVFDKFGKPHECRALLDSGSQTHFITQKLCNQLSLDPTDVQISVIGITQVESPIKSKCNIRIQSRINKYSESITCFIIPEICQNLPNASLDSSRFAIPSHITLADPNFNKSSKIDILLGAELFWKLVCIGQFNLGHNYPVLQKTRLGWIVSGKILSNSQSNKICVSQNAICNFSHNLQDQLTQFWEVEEVGNHKVLTHEENLCETNFKDTTYKNSEGRYVVSIPLKQSPESLGDSKENAIKRFNALERKLIQNPAFKSLYIDFMEEYKSLKHMTEIDPETKNNIYYLPHHGVLKESSSTTKLRVVFDASSPTSNGVSLNDIQIVGPVVQNDLLTITIRFRQHRYVMAADVEKMYRQVLIKPQQRSLQCILWRKEPTEELKTYELNTITYGTASGSYLATRCLQELAKENSKMYPRASNSISNDFYVDDWLSGAETIKEATELCKEVNTILSSACFSLRKWVTNEPSIFKDFIHTIDDNQEHITIAFEQNSKLLGLLWSPGNDSFMYQIKADHLSNKVTKRTILSAISQIFDPLGLLGPCITQAKIMLQKLWSAKLSWDESLPVNLHTEWMQYKQELSNLNELQIKRRIICDNPISIDMHCFCDASTAAYGACIYMRSVDQNNSVHISLVTAKSKVAPIKPLSIPRLELCSALILAKLQAKVTNSLTMPINNFYYWSDSKIVLSWIRTPVNLLKIFIANRVHEIQTLTKHGAWQYVNSRQNPADLISRGITPNAILNADLWWKGPTWLKDDEAHWKNIAFNLKEELPELKSKIHTFVTSKIDTSFINKFSSYNKIVRSIAYCLRFKTNCLREKCERQTGSLTVNEIRSSLNCIIKLIQKEYFTQEICSLERNKVLKLNSKLLSLNPFLDSEGILRVGGRLSQSKYPYEKIHPILLPKGNHFVDLLFQHEHLRLKHASQQQLLYSIRENYWPIAGRNIARKTVHNCLRCYRMKPKTMTPLLGDLPSNRIESSLPFTFTGVDYTGPFLIKDRKGRGCKLQKCYISLFVCFSTRAIHLELVSDLSKEGFIAALRRFTARRGKPTELHSDNGTNFIGANNELKEFAKFLKDSEEVIAETLAQEGIKWYFIPPHSPHLGGLWEAGVKSAKHHLKRVMYNIQFTFEEFYTLLTQIESILNSRPLSPLSSDPNDLLPICPSHFLIGRKITSVPNPDLTHLPVNRLSNYQHIQQLQQHFWNRWAKEYISELQTRRKNKQDHNMINVGDLVLIKEDNLPPFQWKLGRITKLHSGRDQRTRVATIRTSRGDLQRAVSKLCPLPTP